MRRSLVLGSLTFPLLLLAACTASRPEAPAPEPRVETVETGTDALLIGLDAAGENVVWAAGAAGTWARSLDGGRTWTTGKVPGADTLQFRDVEAFSAREAVLLSIGNGASSRVYRTDDGGATWALRWTNADPAAFYDCMAFEDARRGFAFSDAVANADSTRFRLPVIETEDGGRTWALAPPERTPDARPGEGGFASSGTCAVADGDGRRIVTNGGDGPDRLLTRAGGANWRATVLPVRSDDGGRGLSTLARRGTTLYAGLLGDIDSVTVLRGEDLGRAWRPLGRTTIRRVYGLAASPRAGVLAATGPDGLDVSLDDGRTWRHLTSDVLWTVTALSDGTFLAAGRAGKVARITFP